MSPASRSDSAIGSSGLRLKMLMRRWHLDHEIAAGRDCNETAELALRARQLGELRTRRKVSRSLRDLVDYVDHTGSRCSAPPSVAQPMASRFGRAAVLELADRLETARSVAPRGVALAITLLNDGHSPLYDPRAGRSVTEAAREATELLRADGGAAQAAVATSTATNSTYAATIA